MTLGVVYIEPFPWEIYYNAQLWRLQDLVVVPTLLLIIYSLAIRIIKRRYAGDRQMQQNFLIGLTLKLIGGVSIGLVYRYYYIYGDTYAYFTNARNLIEFGFKDTLDALHLFATYNDTGGLAERDYSLTARENNIYMYSWGLQNYTLARIVAIANIFSFNSYIGSALLLGVFSFLGNWGLYRAFIRIFPDSARLLYFALVLPPSLWFWGSGILKDSITFGVLGLLFYLLDKTSHERRINLLQLALAAFLGYLLYLIKAYILFSFLPLAFLFVTSRLVESIESAGLRRVVIPISYILVLAGTFGGVFYLSTTIARYNIENFATNATEIYNDIQRDVYYTDDVTSRYDLGELDGTTSGLLSKAPLAIATALFRPAPWDVNKPIIAISALETLAFTIFFVYVFFVVGPLRFFERIFRNPMLRFCFLYTIVFAFMVGLTSGNFGNMTRYRIPMLPFWLGMLTVLYSQVQQKWIAARNEREERRERIRALYEARYKQGQGANQLGRSPGEASVT